MTTSTEIAFKATSDFTAFLRNHEHDVNLREDVFAKFPPAIEIDSETLQCGFSLLDENENGRYIWEFLHFTSGTLIQSELTENAPMEKIYEFFKDCLEQAKNM